ncbi:thioredoxin [Cyclobacterium amurskyense]|jgi:thioredoxin 1|uniref:Thioredoxin n=1 Tax=Cyclobacterium amurskyense TaxID=320787 RepID=A0A0H4PID6_9BACT|nr:thioredoxin [Cyclobacterium amurskyense]AKP52668.1 Thioredoxin [Cyclobacterium amurskyense]|tara:strand:- start:1792 stop:2112 length:321 start_codon:yes stop_codon:yes gene_type:complete
MAKGKSFSEIIKGDQPVLVDFYATWCGPCKMMQPILTETAGKVGDKAKIIKIDIDKNPMAASRFQVKSVPTLVLFQNGKIVWRQSGVVPAKQLVEVINKQAMAKQG